MVRWPLPSVRLGCSSNSRLPSDVGIAGLKREVFEVQKGAQKSLDQSGFEVIEVFRKLGSPEKSIISIIYQVDRNSELLYTSKIDTGRNSYFSMSLLQNC